MGGDVGEGKLAFPFSSKYCRQNFRHVVEDKVLLVMVTGLSGVQFGL